MLSGVIGCTADSGTPGPPPPGAPADFPDIEPRALTLGNAEPYGVAWITALSDGRLVINDPNESPFLRVYDSTGAELARFGRDGSGPGEVHGLVEMWGHGDTLVVYDESRATIRFRGDGTLLDESPVVGMEWPLSATVDSFDGYANIGARRPAPRPPIERRAIHGIEHRTLLGPGDSIFDLADSLTRFRSMPSGAWLGTPTRNYFGEGWTYTIGVYAPDGTRLGIIRRDLGPNQRSPAALARTRASLELANQPSPGPSGKLMAPSPSIQARLDTLERESIRHFEFGMLRVDGLGRLWVFGDLGEQTFADVFADTAFLGRHVLDCRKPRMRIAMAEDWFALQCHPDAPDADNPFQIRSWRIVEQH